jgi:RNA-directed DNA polymerase
VRLPGPTHPVLGFERREEAERLLQELRERLAKFGLELHPEKTRLIEFGRYAVERRHRRRRANRRRLTFWGSRMHAGEPERGAGLSSGAGR